MLLVWRVAERFEPGYGAAAAVALGLGTMVLPFSTLLFSHVFTAMLGFAAFALMLRERDGPPRPLLLGARGPGDRLRDHLGVPAGLRRGRARAVPALAPRRRCARARWRGGPAHTCSAAIVGIVPLLLYNHAAFHSWTHLAYSEHPAAAAGLLRDLRAEPARAGHAAVRLARPADALARAGRWARVGTVLLYRRGQARRGADDRGRLPLLPDLQLGLLPALRRRRPGAALPDHDAAVPRPARSGSR